MAHSYIMFFDSEIEAFRAFAKVFPKNSTFLIDTYDDLKGAENAATVAKEMEKQGCKLNAVRLDSGDLAALSKKVRRILDKHGLKYVKIFASGDLDEYKIQQLMKQDAKIDAFGVGTRMSTSEDRPYIDAVYKLSGKIENGTFIPAMKLSKDKITLPGKKQIFRQKDRNGKYAKDVIGLEEEKLEGQPLLVKVMEKDNITYNLPALKEIRDATLRNLSEIPDTYRKLVRVSSYPVELSHQLMKIKKRLTSQIKSQEDLPRY